MIKVGSIYRFIRNPEIGVFIIKFNTHTLIYDVITIKLPSLKLFFNLDDFYEYEHCSSMTQEYLTDNFGFYMGSKICNNKLKHD